MWITLLVGGRVNISSISTTRVGVVYTPKPESMISTVRIGVLCIAAPSANLSTTRIGVILKESK